MRNRPILVALCAFVACSQPRADAGSAPAPHSSGPDTVIPMTGALPASLFDPAARLPAPETEHRGAAALGLALRRLGPTQRVLMIGAHPDDESTQILAELALGQGADVAYLSLTRGEGGQNLIGAELEEALGLIRTEELLAARRLDGAVQFFTRAYDFGFSRSADEAFLHWPRDSLLADVVAVVRAWRPDAIVSQFTGTPRDGHGHHQAAGILAREAFAAAADSARFPGQIAAGLRPHTTLRLYQSWFRAPDDTSGVLRLQTGTLDPLFGRSRFQIAMASRSRHRSQDMGRAESMGPQQSLLSAVAPDPGPRLEHFFDGLDRTLVDRLDHDAGSEPLRAYAGDLDRVHELFNPLGGESLARQLLGMVRRLDEAYAETADPELRFHIAAERADAARAALLALGVQLDVTADRMHAHAGDTITLELALWNGGPAELPVQRLEPELPEGWWAESDDAPVTAIAPGAVARRSFRVHVPHDAAVDVPYFLTRPRPADSDMYVWPADYDVRGRPFERPLLRGVALVANALPLEDAAEFVEIDPARGELREPVLVLPAATVDAEPDVLAVPLDDRGQVRLRPRIVQSLDVEDPAREGMRVSWELPGGWDFLSSGERDATAPGTIARTLGAPRTLAPGRYVLRPSARDSIGPAAPGYTIVDYPHIRPRLVPEPPELVLSAFEIDVPRDIRVGYIPGSGDESPAAILALGLAVDTLRASAIATTDLATYDVIVAGARAYEVAPELAAPATRAALERYVHDGGALIVQYNKYEFAEQHMALVPLTMTRPHDRVTDESAAVRLLEPGHPILSWPNRIGPADFEGWVQERGLYFAHTWDDAYSPLLEMADPGQSAQRGGLLAARMGEGWYVYTGLALFRQLPAGVPGAYRLLANLLALGVDRPAT